MCLNAVAAAWKHTICRQRTLLLLQLLSLLTLDWNLSTLESCIYCMLYVFMNVCVTPSERVVPTPLTVVHGNSTTTTICCAHFLSVTALLSESSGLKHESNVVMIEASACCFSKLQRRADQLLNNVLGSVFGSSCATVEDALGSSVLFTLPTQCFWLAQCFNRTVQPFVPCVCVVRVSFFYFRPLLCYVADNHPWLCTLNYR